MASISAVEASAMMESPNWLDMPHEVMVSILQRLSIVEKLRSARKVCRTWRTICKDPAMWKVIDISSWQDGCKTNYNLKMLAKQAVDLSCGELTHVIIQGYCTDDLIDYIVQRSCKLKHLSLWCCKDITGSVWSRAVKRIPQLEKINLFGIYINIEDTEAIGRNCPQLKSFKAGLILKLFVEYDDLAVAIAKSMPNLRHLKIFGSEMTNVGLQAILNGCPHLKLLHIYIYNFRNIDKNLVQLCTERIKDFLLNSPHISDHFNEFSEEYDYNYYD